MSIRAALLQRTLAGTSPLHRIMQTARVHPGRSQDELERLAVGIRTQLDRASHGARVLPGVTIRPEQGGPVRGEWVVHPKADPARHLLYLHGGGYFFGSPRTHRIVAASLSARARAQVFLPEYRLAPEHRFPAALDDAVAVWTWLTEIRGVDPRDAATGGDSAGGGLSLAMLLWLRDHERPLPACWIGLSPWVDLTSSGDSITHNAEHDWMIPPAMLPAVARTYAHDEALDNPYVSPLFGDFAGLPPMLVHVGTTEVFLDDGRRVVAKAREANVDASLAEFEHMWHAFQTMPVTPEARLSTIELGGFVQRHTRGDWHQPPAR